MTHVRGIGGAFFKCPDQEKTLAWYRRHLGLEVEGWGGVIFRSPAADRPSESSYTVWSAFPESSGYFGPGSQQFMLNFRVDGIEELIERLRAEGVEIAGEIEDHPNGRFAWIVDLDGRRVELWQPVPIEDDPYL